MYATMAGADGVMDLARMDGSLGSMSSVPSQAEHEDVASTSEGSNPLETTGLPSAQGRNHATMKW